MRFRVKRVFEPVVHVIALVLSVLKIPLNLVTFIAFGFSIIAFIAFLFQQLLVAVVFTFLNGLFDGVDNELARIMELDNRFSGFFEDVLNRYSDALIILGASVYLDPSYIGLVYVDPLIVGIFTVFGFIIASYTKARAESEGIPCNVGVGGRLERLLLLIIFALLDQLFIALVVLFLISISTALYRLLYLYAVFKYGEAPREVESGERSY